MRPSACDCVGFCFLKQSSNVGLTQRLELLESCVCGLLVAGTLAVELDAFGAVRKDEVERRGRVAGASNGNNALPIVATVDEPSATPKSFANRPDSAG